MMKTARLVALICFAHAALAQHHQVKQSLDEWVTTAEERLVAAADAMPEEKYSFAPTNGEFKDVRTFAEQLKHLAAANHGLSKRIEGRKPTEDELNERAPASVQTKVEIMAYVKDSFVALHKAIATLDDARATTVAKGDKHEPTWFAIDAIAHSLNHYGQIVEYLRMNGIVPPASR